MWLPLPKSLKIRDGDGDIATTNDWKRIKPKNSTHTIKPISGCQVIAIPYQNRSPGSAINPSVIGIALGATSQPHLWSAAPWRRLVFLPACWQAPANLLLAGSKLPEKQSESKLSHSKSTRGCAERSSAIWERTGRNQAIGSMLKRNESLRHWTVGGGR